jgi:hypothetical protein
MKIKLIRTGGFIPVTKTSETEISLSDQELGNLIEIIKHDRTGYRIKDGNYYELCVGNKNTPVDLEKVPEKYKDIFSKLKAELRINKKNI